MKRSLIQWTTAFVMAICASAAWSTPISCGSSQRTATLDSASACQTGSGNPQPSDILLSYPGAAWNRADGDLSVNLTNGSWNDPQVAGNWTIDNGFWSLYSQAVISIHVGNGNGGPDYFAWLLTPNTASGSWSYERLAGKGGGFSNIKLWGRRSAPVPEPATLALLALGLLGFGLSRLGRKRRH